MKKEAPTYPIHINNSNKFNSAQTYEYLSYVRYTQKAITLLQIAFEDMSQHVFKCRVVSTPWPHNIFLCQQHDQRHVADMLPHDTPCLQMKAWEDTTE